MNSYNNEQKLGSDLEFDAFSQFSDYCFNHYFQLTISALYQDSVCIVSYDSYNQPLLFSEKTLTDRVFFTADAGSLLYAVANEFLNK